MLTEDMMMFTQQETLFLALPDNFVTGWALERGVWFRVLLDSL